MVQTTTATCFCESVQLALPVEGPDVGNTHVCNCTDCRKITASMFSSLFSVQDAALRPVRGQDKLARYARSDTTTTGNNMANYFCSVCGTLMISLLRMGTLDDRTLCETRLGPVVEQFTKDRMSWFKGVEGTEQCEGFYFAEQATKGK